MAGVVMTDELGVQLTNIKEEIGDIKRSLSRISDALRAWRDAMGQ